MVLHGFNGTLESVSLYSVMAQYITHSSKTHTCGYGLISRELHTELWRRDIYLPLAAHRSRYDGTVKKSAQAASEIKPVSRPAYTSEFKLKISSGRTDLKKKPNRPWWTYYLYPRSAGRKKFARRLEPAEKMSQRREKLSSETIRSTPAFPLESDRKRDTYLSPDTDVVKITTIVETIRRKGQRGDARVSEGTENIQRIIEKRRTRRSPDEAGNGSTAIKRYARNERASVTSERSPELRYGDRRWKTVPRVTRANDLRTANNRAIPSTVFYKRIWEYINGTRPHADIISDYNSLENIERDNSSCNDKERAGAAQTRENELQTLNPDVKPEREFYKRIWDIINATRSAYGDARVRSRRDARVRRGEIPAAVRNPRSRCAQKRKAEGNGEGKRAQTTSNVAETPLSLTADAMHARETADPDPYVSGFWTLANKTQWEPETVVPVVNLVKLSDEPILSPRANTASASKVADLNEFPHDARSNVGDSSTDNSTVRIDEAPRNESADITVPGPPYPVVRENATASSSLPNERAIDNASRKDEETKHAEHQSADNPVYDPANIPYVEVPDYTDQREDSLDKSNRTTSADNNQEYYDSDYGEPERSYNDDNSSSKSPSTDVKSVSDIRAKNVEQGSPVYANVSHHADIKNPAETTEQRDNGDSKPREDDTSGDIQHPAEDTAGPASSAESENSTVDFAPVHFDIKEYEKPFDLDSFIKNDPILKGVGAATTNEDTKHDDKENSDRNNDRSVEDETYSKEEPYDYLTKNENLYDDLGAVSDEKDDAKKNTEEETKDSEVTNEDYYPEEDKDFFKHIFGEDRDQESSDIVDTEDEFLSRYFTEDVLDKLRDNSTAEEDRKREESRNREAIQNTLSRILDKKDRFSRLNEGLDKMIEDGEAIPIKYNNFWSLEYESPHKRNKAEEKTEEEEEEEGEEA